MREGHRSRQFKFHAIAWCSFSNVVSIAENDQLNDQIAPSREIKGQEQQIRQALMVSAPESAMRLHAATMPNGRLAMLYSVKRCKSGPGMGKQTRPL